MDQTRWELPETDVEMAEWIVTSEPEALDQFIENAEFLLGSEDGESELTAGTWEDASVVIATVLGAARQWRDHGVDPLRTIRSNAPANFYVQREAV